MRTTPSPAAILAAILLPLLSIQSGCTSADSVIKSTAGFPPGTGFVSKTVTIDGKPHRYALFIPRGYTPGVKFPAIHFLHGLFEAGSDGQHQLTAGLAPVIAHNPDAWPFIVIFPQSTGTWTGPDRDRLAMACLDDAIAAYDIDPDRIILSGFSFGGMGVWDIGANHRDRFAALVPFSAVSDTDLNPLRLITIPIWCFHNRGDPIVSARASEEFCKRIADAGGHITYTQFPALAHDSCPNAFEDTTLLTWMLHQRRTTPQ